MLNSVDWIEEGCEIEFFGVLVVDSNCYRIYFLLLHLWSVLPGPIGRMTAGMKMIGFDTVETNEMIHLVGRILLLEALKHGKSRFG